MRIECIEVDEDSLRFLGRLPSVGVQGHSIVIPGLLDWVDGELLLEMKVGFLSFHYFFNVASVQAMMDLPQLPGILQIFFPH